MRGIVGLYGSRRTALDGMLKDCTQLSGIVGIENQLVILQTRIDALSVAQQDGDAGHREPVELGRLARSVWDGVDLAEGRLLVENDRIVSANRSLLTQLFESLFRSIADRCTAGVTVTVRGTDSGFSVSDDGPELSPETAGSLFGDTVGDRRVQFNLVAVEQIVSAHGWEGRVETDDETRFVFSGVGAVTSPVHEPTV